MSVIPQPMTYEDLQQIPHDGNRYEIVDGEPIVSPAPPRLHEKLTIRLLLLIQAYLLQEQLGDDIYTAPVDVRLAEHTVVQPDLFFIRPERRHILADSGLIDGAPDLVVEILSPSNRAVDEKIKHRLYERAGVPAARLGRTPDRRPPLRARGGAGILVGRSRARGRDHLCVA